MNFSEYQKFFKSFSHIIDLNTSRNCSNVAKSVTINGSQFSLHKNMVNDQLFCFIGEHSKEVKFYICESYPSKWVDIKNEDISKFINFIKFQDSQIQSFNIPMSSNLDD